MLFCSQIIHAIYAIVGAMYNGDLYFYNAEGKGTHHELTFLTFRRTFKHLNIFIPGVLYGDFNPQTFRRLQKVFYLNCYINISIRSASLILSQPEYLFMLCKYFRV